MKLILTLLIALSPILFASSCLFEPRNDDRYAEDYYYDSDYDEDEFYIIGEDERPVDDPDAISAILQQCTEDLYMIDDSWSQLLLGKVFEEGYPEDYMAEENLEADYAEFLYKNDDLIVLGFEIVYNFYFPKVSAVIGVYDIDNGELISSKLFERFVGQQNIEKNGYMIEYYIDFYAMDAKDEYGDTLTFIDVTFDEEQSEFDEDKTGRSESTIIDIETERYFSLTSNGKFHETKYIYRDFD
ncbi:MAG: hypothetical protein GQ574_28255 [Crocinitomix sp.]|nr:hypothetical protein [Crocinitomix sp.]